MTQNKTPFPTRRFFLATGIASPLAIVSCSREGSESEARINQASKTFKMGERAAVGLLTYNVLEATYFTQLGNVGNYQIPDKRFLVIRLSITNGGAREAEVPLFRLVDDAGVEIQEVSDASYLPGWLGIIRKIGPTQTEEGRIVFDVPPRSYRLEITDGAEPGKEKLAFVEIPIEFDTSEPVPSATRP